MILHCDDKRCIWNTEDKCTNAEVHIERYQTLIPTVKVCMDRRDRRRDDYE